ncbi:MAG: DUF3180 domain-containing protein [Nocardioides sp.]
MSIAALTCCVVAGLCVGWALNRIGVAVWGYAPVVTWSQAAAPFVASLVLSIVARVTWLRVQYPARRTAVTRSGRPVERSSARVPLEFQQAVNRVLLARASALVGSAMAGGYLGFAVSWLWRPGDYAGAMVTRSVIAGVGALLMTLSALALQRACRVSKDGDST